MFQHILEPKKDSTCIRELRIGAYTTFHELSLASVVVNILAPKQVGGGGSKTEKITSLDLLDMSGSDNADLASVIDAVGANPTGIQLQGLHFFDLSDTGWDSLIRCLPKLLYLKQLSINFVADRVSPENLLRALRQNGSLQDVDIGRIDAFTGDHLFNQRQSRLVQSYCKRNQAIPTMVGKPRLKEDDTSATDLCLFPTLFAAAKQARRTAPNVMLSGLLNAGDSIGAKSGIKRKALP